jgi:hypothetical protein
MTLYNSIDNLIDQIDKNFETDLCCKCLCRSNQLFYLRCSHCICLKCIEKLINEKKINSCPACNHALTKNLHKIFSNFIADPIAKLSYYHDIHKNDVIWWYGGNSHNWLYSKYQSTQLNDAYQTYQNDNSGNNQTSLQIQIDNTVQTYVIDFDELVQYSIAAPNKKRPISCFEFTSLSDLKKNNIIGISGKLL